MAAGPEAGPREEGASAVMARSEASVARRLSRVMGLIVMPCCRLTFQRQPKSGRAEGGRDVGGREEGGRVLRTLHGRQYSWSKQGAGVGTSLGSEGGNLRSEGGVLGSWGMLDEVLGSGDGMGEVLGSEGKVSEAMGSQGKVGEGLG